MKNVIAKLIGLLILIGWFWSFICTNGDTFKWSIIAIEIAGILFVEDFSTDGNEEEA